MSWKTRRPAKRGGRPMQTEKMRAFVLRVVYWCTLAGLVYAGAKYVLPALAPFALGFGIAFVLKPAINRLTALTHRSRKAVAVWCLAVFYVLFATVLIVLGTRLVIFLQDSIAMIPGAYETFLAPSLERLQAWMQRFVAGLHPVVADFIASAAQNIDQTLSALATGISKGALAAVTWLAKSLPNFLMNFLLTVIASFFCTVDYCAITAFLARMLPEKARRTLFSIKASGVDVLAKFCKAYAVLLGITFAQLCVGLVLLRVPYAVFLAALIAVVDILPVLGTGTVLVPWGVGAILSGNMPLGAGLLILYAIISVVRQALEPRIVGHQIGLYPLVTLMSMFLGAKLFGFVGLFGLPVAVTVFVQLRTAGRRQSASAESAQL